MLAGSLDTNVLLRLMLKDVPNQHAAAVRLLRSTEDQFSVADTAVIEIVFVLGRNYGFDRDQIAIAVGGLMDLVGINCSRELFARVLPLFTKHPKLSFEDCCLAVYAELGDAQPLWTFDRKLAAQASGARLVDDDQNEAEF